MTIKTTAALAVAAILAAGATPASAKAHRAGHSARHFAHAHSRVGVSYRAFGHRGHGAGYAPVAAVAQPAAQQSPLGLLGAIFGGQPAAPVASPPVVAFRSARRAARSAIVGAEQAVGSALGGSVGMASYYSGGRTASGGSVGAATCAHRYLPFGTKVLVTNLNNARQAVLTVNDRGPFVGGRIVDVSRTAAGTLGMIGSGVARVRVAVLR